MKKTAPQPNSSPWWTLLGVLFALWLGACGLPDPAAPTATPPATAVSLATAVPLATGSAPAAADSPPDSQPTATRPPAEDASGPQPTLTPVFLPTETEPPAANSLPFVGLYSAHLGNPEKASLIAASGAVWTRHDSFHWDLIEPVRTDPPTYDWSSVDEAALQNAAANGLQMIGLVQYAPDWAQKYAGIACGPVAEDALGAFGQFMAALAARYGDVTHWELGNEPDVGATLVPPHSGFGCWGEPDELFYGGGYYAEMLEAVYPQIKTTNPNAQVLVGGLLLDCNPVAPPESPPGSGNLRDCTPTTFIEGVLAAGGGAYFDGISFHAYDYYYETVGYYGNVNWVSGFNRTGLEPVVTAKTRYLRDLLAQYGVDGKALINTETALLCGSGAGAEAHCHAPAFEQMKAGYVVQANAAAFAAGLRANLWYSLDSGWRATNLEGDAYRAFQFSAMQLADATYASPITNYAGVIGYRFVRESGDFWLLWSFDTEAHTVELPAQPGALYDMLGEPLPASQTVEVGVLPVYVVWGR